MSPSRSDERLRTFGDRIRKLRLGYGLSQQDIATRLGLTRSSITNIEAGRQNLSLTALLELSEVLDVPVGVLVGEIDMPELEKLKQARDEVSDLETQARLVTKQLLDARRRLATMAPDGRR